MPRTMKKSPGRGSGKRTLVQNAAGDFYARRDAKGQFKEMDERGRATSADRRQQAANASTPGRGDKGDRKPR